MTSSSPLVYEDDSLIVEAIENGASSYLIVFAVRLPVDSRGDNYLSRLGFNLIFVRAKNNRAWEAAGVAAALDAVRERTASVTQRIAFGTGLGAYGALAFGSRLGCSAVVMVSPETPPDLDAVAAFPPAIHLFFDSCLAEDRPPLQALVERVRAGGGDIRLHPLPFSGRPSYPVLLDLGTLKPVFDSLMAGKPATGWENYRSLRKTSRHMYLALMTNTTAIRKHPALVEKAARHFREHHAENDKIALRYARLLDNLDRPAEALTFVQEIFSRKPVQPADTHVFHARLQRRVGNIKEAIAAYDRALEDPKVDPTVKVLREQLLQHDSQELLEAWKNKEWALILDLAKELEKGPLPSAGDCALIGRAAFKLKKFVLAEKWARRATMLEEGNAAHHGSLGDIYKKEGKLLSAFQSYTRAKILQPESVIFSLRIADMLRLSVESMPEQSTIGLDMLHTALVVAPADELTNLQRNASLLGQFGDFAAAGHLLRKALELDPKNGTIKRLLAEANRNGEKAQDEEADGLAQDEMSFLPDVIASGLLSGNDWTTVYLRQIRLFLGQKRRSNAHTFCNAIFSRHGVGAVEGLLCLVVVAHGAKLTEFCRQIFDLIPRETSLKYVPLEYFSVLFGRDPQVGETLCREWLNTHFESIDNDGWLACARAAAVVGLTALSREILDKLIDPAFATGFKSEEISEILNMRELLALTAEKRQTATDGRIHIGILNYRSLDYRYTSKNIGDHIQTVSLLSNLARFGDVTYADGPALAPFVRDLQQRIQPDRRLQVAPVEVELHEVQRDYSTCATAPDGTWLMAFGWHMHSLFQERLDFPYRPGLRPIFISFHVANPALLTDAAIAYLRQYGPVGCRDWYTVDLLRGQGIPAYFSGCLTSTIDNLLRVSKPQGVPPAKVGLVDLNLPPTSSHQVAGKMTAEQPGVKTKTQVENLHAAIAQLEGYAVFDLIYTSRLHCYLPLTSIGVPIDFRPKRPADPRFEGLSGFNVETISSLRNGLLDKLEAIFRKILSGADEAEVYRFWGELCAPDMAFADDYLTPIPDFNFPAEEHVAQILSRKVDYPAAAPKKAGEPINLAFAADANLQEEFLVALESVQAQASRPLRVWLLSRELGPDYFERCHRVFPAIDFHFLPCDGITYGNILGMLPNITVSTMDRLFLPELLSDVAQIIYLDIDILVRCDLAEMADIDLKGNRLAGVSSVMDRWQTGYLLIESCAMRLSRETAAELRRRMHARHDMRFTGFNAGVLILNLQRMRDEKFCEQFIPFAGTYGMNDQEVLNCYAGSERLALKPDWNCVPSQNLTYTAKIVHWAGASKPWNNRWLPGHDEWRRYEASVRARL